jgi:uncharacterized protein YndB with AHSA1/START domain
MPTSAYSLSFSGDFAHPAEAVFELFTDLTKIHLWNVGMLAVTDAPRMHKGLVYTASSINAGQLSRSRVEITDYELNRKIEMTNNTGVITYRALTLFEPTTPGHSRITCRMKFSLSAGLLDEARPVIEAMAEARIRGNWQMLNSVLTQQPQ